MFVEEEFYVFIQIFNSENPNKEFRDMFKKEQKKIQFFFEIHEIKRGNN